MEPNFKPDGAKKTALSENVVDALCRFVCLTFVGRWDRVFFMGYYTGTGPVVTSPRIVPGVSMAELVLPDGTKVWLDREANRALEEGVKNSGDTLNYTEVVASGIQDSSEIYHTLRVPRGGEYTLVLADGTTVYLNAESELRFPKQFKGKSRKVYLDGEGYLTCGVTRNSLLLLR